MSAAMVPQIQMTVEVNGQAHTIVVEARMTLATALRDCLSLTGTRVGCDEGVCGTCTVLVDNEPVRACMLLAVQAHGRDVRTIEGIADENGLHPLQSAFVEHHAVQCGYCTAGFIMLALSALRRQPDITEAELVDILSANLCRCTGYGPIVTAVRKAQARMNGETAGARLRKAAGALG